MPRPRFERLPPARQRAVFETAAQEFVAHGYHGASINRIQKTLSLSKGAFYYWFDDKEDLFLAVIADRIDAMKRTVGGLMDGPAPSVPLWLQVESTCAAIFRYIIVHPDTMMLLKAALVLRPDLSPRLQALWATLLGATEALVVEGQRRGEVRTDLPASLLASVAHGMLEGLDRHMLREAPDVDPTASAALYVDLLRRALGPSA